MTNYSFSSVLASKFNGILPEDIIVISDYDLTLAAKDDPTDTDKAPLKPHHYVGLRNLADRIGRLVILTARGEESVLNYLGEHAPTIEHRIPNITLASNSGHLWHKLDLPREAEPRIIPIPGLNEAMRWKVVGAIHKITGTLQKEFPDITSDVRELCGAVIHQFPQDEGSNPASFSRFDAFTMRADELKAALPHDVAAQIKYAPKAWEGIDPNGVTRKMGYIDMLPKGLNKGLSASELFCHYNAGNPNGFVIVAGDSTADFDMMTALAQRVPESRRLFISVGKGLVACDEKYAANNNGQRLLDCVLMGNGISPIEEMHVLLDNVGHRHSTLDARCARIAAQGTGAIFAAQTLDV